MDATPTICVDTVISLHIYLLVVTILDGYDLVTFDLLPDTFVDLDRCRYRYLLRSFTFVVLIALIYYPFCGGCLYFVRFCSVPGRWVTLVAVTLRYTTSLSTHYAFPIPYGVDALPHPLPTACHGYARRVLHLPHHTPPLSCRSPRLPQIQVTAVPTPAARTVYAHLYCLHYTHRSLTLLPFPHYYAACVTHATLLPPVPLLRFPSFMPLLSSTIAYTTFTRSFGYVVGCLPRTLPFPHVYRYYATYCRSLVLPTRLLRFTPAGFARFYTALHYAHRAYYTTVALRLHAHARLRRILQFCRL